MKIAVVTDNEKTISQHFGRARGFVVLTLKDGRIAHRETRLRTGGCDGHGHEENHEHDHTGGHTGHNCGALVELISDCGAVLVHRMGGGLYQRLQAADIRPVFTELQNIEEAVGALLAGTLTESQPQLCH